MSTTVYSSHYRAFLKQLRRARLEAGLTQADVAKKLGCHQSFVSKCESGERRVDVIELARFARIYGKPFPFFIPDTVVQK
jgi:transcriptional regulator with XRE-family HTH domain